MGYACPVCGDPQADRVHLANHLAFTAMLRGGDHEAWLDEHLPGWADQGEDELATRVTEHARQVEYPQVFEDTTDDGHDHDEPPAEEHIPVAFDEHALEEFATDDTREVVAEARELTRQRRTTDEDERTDDTETDEDS